MSSPKTPRRLLSSLFLLALTIGAAGQESWLEPECEALWEVVSPETGDFFGWAVTSVGDVTRDGVPDLAVSADFGGTGGRMRVYSGADGTIVWTRNESLSNGVLGFSLETTDWNGDGVLDVVAGAPFNGPTGGRVFVYSGVDGQTLQVFNPSDVNDEGFGAAIATGGDYDGDGIDDILICAFLLDVPPGPVLVDFETAGDFFSVLTNGQKVSDGATFDGLFSLSANGPAQFGAAIFDSNPPGPNQFSTDPDLLVGRGKILILQENASQSTPGLFDAPDDSALGGTLRFDFVAPSHVQSIGLVDICPGPQEAMVTLADTAGLLRQYLVPGGWTGDAALHPGEGHGTLDLTRLDDQPGFLATATALEDVGFDPTSCVSMVVSFAGSGGLSEILLDAGLPQRDHAGRVYVFSGVDGSILETIDGAAEDTELGIGLAYLGDISVPPDGRDEFVVGNRLANDFFAGQARVYSHDGEAPVVLYVIEDVGMGFNLGGDRIDAGKDVNLDGVPDILVGDRANNLASVFSGADGTHLFTVDGNADGGGFGSGRLIDDVDGDRHADVIVGSWSADTIASNAGRVYLYSGATGSLIRTMSPLTPDRRFGVDVRSAGDFDGDGEMDFVVGATGGNFSGPPRGRAFVISGVPAAEQSQRDPLAKQELLDSLSQARVR